MLRDIWKRWTTAAPPSEHDIPTPGSTTAVSPDTGAYRMAMGEAAERQRVAALLHDELQPGLAGLRLLLCRPETAAEAAAALDTMIARTRALSHSLLDTSTDFGTGIQALAEHFTAWHRIHVHVEQMADFSSTTETTVILLSMVREILFNTSKHAAGANVSISLRDTAHWHFIVIADDGPGYDPREVRQGGGSQTLEWKAASLGGHIDRWSAIGAGSRVTLCIPRAKTAEGTII